MSTAIAHLDAVPWEALSAQQRRIATALLQHAVVAAREGDSERVCELLTGLPLDAESLHGGVGRGEPPASYIAQPPAAPPVIVDLRNSLVELLSGRS